MKTKFGILAVGLLLFSASAFAGEQPKADVTIQVEEKNVATISMKEQPEGATLIFNCSPKSSAIYDDQKSTMTIKGPFSVEVIRAEKSLLHLDVADGGTVWNPRSTVASPPPLSIVPVVAATNHPGNFCGQAEINRLFLETQMEKQRERAEAARLAATKTAARPATETAPQK